MEAGDGIVPHQALQHNYHLEMHTIALMKKKFGKLDFKKFHPSGNLGLKLKTAGDLMLVGKKYHLFMKA